MVLRPVGPRGRASRKEPPSIQTSSVQGSELSAGSSGGTSVGGGGASVGGSAVGSSTSGSGSVGAGISVGGSAGSVASASVLPSGGKLLPVKQAADTTKMMAATVSRGRVMVFFIRLHLALLGNNCIINIIGIGRKVSINFDLQSICKSASILPLGKSPTRNVYLSPIKTTPPLDQTTKTFRRSHPSFVKMM